MSARMFHANMECAITFLVPTNATVSPDGRTNTAKPVKCLILLTTLRSK